jgi:glutathione peroxidase
MAFAHTQTPTQKSLYEFGMKDIDGKEVTLDRYKGKVLLIVNVASKCGNTPQYKDLEAMYQKYKDQGFVILGFPANNFLFQEPGTDAEIKAFCSTTYGVTFDMFSKISVKGKDQHPLYTFLTSEKTNPKFPGEIKWNFEKFLVDKEGNLVGRFAPKMKPSAQEVVTAVESALKRN